MLEDHPGVNRAIGMRGPGRAGLWKAIAEHRRDKMLPVVNAYREALAEDGWSIEPTYGHEPVEHAWSAHREGFKVMGLARPIPSKRGEIPKPDLHAWGPDGATVKVPHPYSFEAFVAGLRRCDQCGAEDVDVDRYAFANRCCAECGPKFMASLPRNWAD